MTDTRDKFLDVATRHFAERGFYGVSIAQVSTELSLSKQALLHHFGNKERLYAEVLKRISDDLMQQITAPDEGKSGISQVQAVFISIYRNAKNNLDATQLLVRELLDNKQRAKTAQHWYLVPFLETLTNIVTESAKNKQLSKTQALAVIYQFIASIHYFLISGATLQSMFGNKQYQALDDAYEQELLATITSRLEAL